MAEKVTIAIVGAGPGGLSAAARAAETRTSHLLLEAAPQIANTIFRYQKGKHVMAEPGILPLRAAVGFEAGTRERILKTWHEGIIKTGANARFTTEVASIKGERGNFTLKLIDGSELLAENVVIAIGLQGNLRKLEVPGDDLPHVIYQLYDPDD